jgi:hypothetical protein
MPIILVSWEAEIEEFTVPGESREKVCETPSQWQKAGHGGAHLSFQLGWEASRPDEPGQKATPYLQNNQQKKG